MSNLQPNIMLAYGPWMYHQRWTYNTVTADELIYNVEHHQPLNISTEMTPT